MIFMYIFFYGLPVKLKITLTFHRRNTKLEDKKIQFHLNFEVKIEKNTSKNKKKMWFFLDGIRV